MEVQKQSYKNKGKRWGPFNTFAKYAVITSKDNGFHVWIQTSWTAVQQVIMKLNNGTL